MKVRVLGCSGGIGGRHLRTTSLLVDHDILIDAGTGVGDLSLAELALIDHVFITHSHLDHLACLPFMVDTVGDMRNKPLTVHATQATLEIIQAHLFNWAIWPDFSEIPSRDRPFMRYAETRLGKTVKVDGREITPLPANHTVPAVGYRSTAAKAAWCSAATRRCATTCGRRQQDPQPALSHHRDRLLQPRTAAGVASKHLCPDMLKEELLKLQRRRRSTSPISSPGRSS
jgi:cAMP phosphodiesterase